MNVQLNVTENSRVIKLVLSSSGVRGATGPRPVFEVTDSVANAAALPDVEDHETEFWLAEDTGVVWYSNGTTWIESNLTAHAATGVSVDASGFDGNLTTSDDTVQKVAQKLDDLVATGGTGVADGATLTTGLTFPTAGLHVLDIDASHDLILSPGSNLTADRTLTLTTGDENRTLTIGASASVAGSNTGDQDLSGYVTKATYDANSILAATADNTPAAVTVAEQTLVGRITSGAIDDLSATQVRTLLNVADGATAAGATGDAFASSHPGGNQHIDWTADQGATNIHSGNLGDLSSTYATAAKGVTNGDSHDHSGGDGAQIAYSGLSGLPTLGTAAAAATSDFAAASHVHGNVTSAGAIGSTANLPVITTTSGALTVGAFGTGATNFCAGNDARLSDARTPSSHASSHNAGGADALAIDAAAATGSLRTLGTTATSACAGNDARLSDARTPSAHAASHASGAADAIKLDDFSAPDDNTDLNASTTAHGLLLKATAPASGLLNVVGIGNGETAYANKALFDTTNPAALGTAAPGTALVAARRDHVHAAPASGYALTFQCANLVTLADATEYFFGNSNVTPAASARRGRIYFPKAGTLTIVDLFSFAITAGTNESWEIFVRLSDTTNYSLGALTLDTNDRRWLVSNLTIAVTTSDYIEFTMTTPTWATNPANLRFNGVVWVTT